MLAGEKHLQGPKQLDDIPLTKTQGETGRKLLASVFNATNSIDPIGLICCNNWILLTARARRREETGLKHFVVKNTRMMYSAINTTDVSLSMTKAIDQLIICSQACLLVKNTSKGNKK